MEVVALMWAGFFCLTTAAINGIILVGMKRERIRVRAYEDRLRRLIMRNR
jgi:hypothetical protein